jgi:hypothetical protein
MCAETGALLHVGSFIIARRHSYREFTVHATMQDEKSEQPITLAGGDKGSAVQSRFRFGPVLDYVPTSFTS